MHCKQWYWAAPHWLGTCPALAGLPATCRPAMHDPTLQQATFPTHVCVHTGEGLASAEQYCSGYYVTDAALLCACVSTELSAKIVLNIHRKHTCNGSNLFCSHGI